MAPLFFIVGFQRSGTTLLRMMLDSHPEIAIPLDVVGLWARYEEQLPQYNFLTDAADIRRMVQDILREDRIRLWQVPLDTDQILELRSSPGLAGIVDAFGTAYARAKGKRFWGDKDPGNMVRIDQLNRWFPSSRIIHIIRDGRDACLSHLEQDFGHKDVLACASAWREEIEWVRRIGRLLGNARYFELRYEDLLADPETVLARVTTFIGVPYSARMLEYHTRVDQGIPREKRHIWKHIGEPPRLDNAAKWKREMRRPLRICFEKRAGMALRDLGYEVLSHPGGAYVEEMRQLAGRAWTALRERMRSGRTARPV